MLDSLIASIKLFFSDDLDVMSTEVREILANPRDAQKYISAINRIKNGEQEVTITLSNQKEFTLIQ